VTTEGGVRGAAKSRTQIDKTGAHRHLTMGHEVPVHFEEIQGTSVAQ